MKNEQGNTIVVTMMVIVTMTALIGVAFDFTTNMDRNGKRAEAYAAAANIADGLLDQQFQLWKSASQNRGASGEITTADLKNTLASYTPISASVASTQNGFYYTQDLTVAGDGFMKDFKITHVDGFGNDVTTAVTPRKASEDYLRPTISNAAALRNFYYKGHVGVSVPVRARTGPSIRMEANRYFVKRFKSPWSFAIFYNDTLEINPGPDMYVNGWIHSNGTIYTGSNSLHMMGRVTYAKGYEANFAPEDSTRRQTDLTKLDIYKGGTDLVSGSSVGNGYLDNWLSSSPPAPGQTQSVIDLKSSGFDPASTGTYGKNDDGYQEVIQVPDPEFPDPPEIASERFYNKADVVLQVKSDTSGATVVTMKTKVSETATGLTVYGAEVPYNTAASDSMVKPGQIVRDNRWAGSIDVTDVDVSQIKAKVDSGALSGVGGLTVYVYDSRGTSTVKKGIRLVRGATLPSSGLTIASQNPIYVQGDYNTNGTYANAASKTPATQPPSNAASADQTKPVITGTTQKPSAIIGDAITVLSNAWSDANTNPSGTKASKTTVNSAFMTGNVESVKAVMTGNVETVKGSYSGGAENFPRFLENWDNTEFTYWGSMVQLFQSQQANEPWGKGSVYTAPLRRWNFDPRLINSPPPGTPLLVSYSKIDSRWFLQ